MLAQNRNGDCYCDDNGGIADDDDNYCHDENYCSEDGHDDNKDHADQNDCDEGK